MATREEVLPLKGSDKKMENRGQRTALGASLAFLLMSAVAFAPPLVSTWHPTYYSSLSVDNRGWAWASANNLWLALAMIWTLFHVDNGPCVATACLLSTVLLAYEEIILISQAIRGQLPWIALADFVVQTGLLALCIWATRGGVAIHSHGTRAERNATWRRVFRKWVLVAASTQLFLAFIACWASHLPWTPPATQRESAPWEWNSAVLLVMALAVLWAAFLARGGLVDETKRAACAWCVLVFTGTFVLSSFSWPALGLKGGNTVMIIILGMDVSVLVFAAVV